MIPGSESTEIARPGSSAEWTEHALERLASGQAAQAAEAFRAALQADYENIEAHHGLVRALCNAGKPDAAVVAALALTVLTPNDPLAHTGLSIALQQAGKIPQAEAAAGRARILEWKQQLIEDEETHADIP